MLMMGIVATAAISLTIRAFTDTATITNRRDVFDEGRLALDQLTKQLRQGESVDGSSTASQVTFSSYVDGTATDLEWRVTGSSAPYTLEQSRDGGTTYLPMVDVLTSSDLFTYTSHDGVIDQITVTLSLETTTSEVEISSDVELRNA